jgi:flagellar basal-body rod protein FlgF
MYKGIYIAASGAILKQTQLEVLTQNIANANTAGYKKDTLSFKEYLFQTEAGGEPDGRAMSDFSSSKTDFSTGTIISTGNPLDIAIEGNGYLALEGGKYTRRGDLKKDGEGYLTTHDGIKVQGSGGPIMLPVDSIEVNINGDGKVMVTQQGSTIPTEIDTLKIMDFGPGATVTKSGDGLFTSTAAGTPATGSVRQGYLESSNVDAVREMVRMIDTMREFETYQKVIQTFDDATSKVTNDLGRL